MDHNEYRKHDVLVLKKDCFLSSNKGKPIYREKSKSTPFRRSGALAEWKRKKKKKQPHNGGQPGQWAAPLISPGSPVNPPSYLLLIIH